MKKRFTYICFMIFAIVGCDSEKENKAMQDSFPVLAPMVIDTVITNEYVAEINALQNVEIRTRIQGFIEAIHVDEGQTVNAGQILFSISSIEYQQELQKAKALVKSAMAELKSAEIELENAQKLLDKKIISKPEFDLAKSKVDEKSAAVSEAEANEAQATLNLSFTEIKAPFSGIINRIPNKSGSLLEEGDLLTTISNDKEIYTYFNVSEKDYLDYILSKKEGRLNEVNLLLANNTIYSHKGVIETVESEFDKATGNIAFRAKFPNPEQLLKHGASGKVLVKTSLKNAMLIPQKSTFEIQGNTYVYVVDKNNQVQMRKIVPATRLPHLYAISSGLSANEKFIYEGIQKVKEGDKVDTKSVLFSQITNF